VDCWLARSIEQFGKEALLRLIFFIWNLLTLPYAGGLLIPQAVYDMAGPDKLSSRLLADGVARGAAAFAGSVLLYGE
jgi:hypothetical protein